MGNFKIHIETTQLVLGILRKQKHKEVSRQEIADLIRKEKGILSNYTMSSVIRELVRSEVLIRKRVKSEYKYLINKTKINEFAKMLVIMETNIVNMKEIKTKISKFNVLTRKEINILLPSYSVIVIDQIIMNLQKQGFIAKIYGMKSRGKYIVKPEPDNKSFISNPISGAISIFGKNILFCYNTALELHGLSRYGMSFVIYIHGISPQKSRTLGDVTIKAVRIRVPDIGKKSLSLSGNMIYLTDLERTIIDCIHRPNYSVGWENVLYALHKIDKINETRVLEYLKAIRIPSLFSKLGIVLEHFQEKWKIHSNILNEMRMYRPYSPVRFFRKESGKINKIWNVYVPEWLFEKIK